MLFISRGWSKLDLKISDGTFPYDIWLLTRFDIAGGT